MKHYGIVSGLLLVALSFVRASGAEPEIVTIRGERFSVWPTSDLAQRGLDVRDIPRDRNAAWVYIEAINAYEELPHELEEAFAYAHKTAFPAEHAKLRAFLSTPANRRAMDLARRAAAMEACQMPYFGDPRSSIISILLPNLSGMRRLARLLVADGRRLEAEGQYDAAVDNYLTTMRMGVHGCDGITLIENLVVRLTAAARRHGLISEDVTTP